MQPLVSIITVNYNQAAVTCDLLRSIEAQDYANLEVIVVDNGSKENPAPLIESQFPKVKLILSPKNLGFAGGNNLGLQKATGEFHFFVNNDTELTHGLISTLINLFQRVPRLGIASPLICYFPSGNHARDLIQYAGMTPINPITGRNKTIGNKTFDEKQYAEAHPTAYAHGAAMMVPATVLAETGPMAEEFFLYYEELDWCARIRNAGFDIWIEPNARIYHKESLTVQKLGALKTYFLNRNRFYFMRRNFSSLQSALFQVFLWLVTVPKNLAVLLLKGEFANAKAFLQGILWNYGFFKQNKFEAMRPL